MKKGILIVLSVLGLGVFLLSPPTLAQDLDADGVEDIDDNCPNHPNGIILGTCVRLIGGAYVGTGVLCTDISYCEYEQGEICDMDQGDDDENGIGDACECYADCNCDTKIDLADLVVTKYQFLRNDCPGCTSTMPTTSISTTTIPFYTAPVEKTGQIASYAAGDDGDLEKGVAWPNPRFIVNSDGTVKDMLTGLIWLRYANCFGTRFWLQALSNCNGLADGQCGLTDDSREGDWRLPNKRELLSLVHDGYSNPEIQQF